MAIRIKGVTILDTTATMPINRLTDVLGVSVDKLNARVEIDATTDPLPDEIPVEVRVLEPKLRRAGMSSMKGSLNTKAQRKAGTRMYLASVALSSFAKFMTAGDSLKEVATVVRDGGTSSRLFRSKLAGGGWAVRAPASKPPRASPT